MKNIEEEIKKFPPLVAQEINRSLIEIKPILTEESLSAWIQEGFSISRQEGRSWEVAVEYFRNSCQLAANFPFSEVIRWARLGADMAQHAPAMAIAYFRSSAVVGNKLAVKDFSRWAQLGQSLYKGTWRSTNLAVRFFEVTPGLLEVLSFSELEVLVEAIDVISSKSPDMSVDCLVLSEKVLCSLGDEKMVFVALIRALADENWREVRRCLEEGLDALLPVHVEHRSRFLRLAESMVRNGHREAMTFLRVASQAMQDRDTESQRHILDLCDLLFSLEKQAVPSFLRSLPIVLKRLALTELDVWFEQGIMLLRQSPDKGLAYFKIESNTAEQALELLSASVELDKVKPVLNLYCRALSGCPIQLLSTKELVDKSIGWVSENNPATEGTSIFLPGIAEIYQEKQQNFLWMKVLSTHQVAHLEFGSFQFCFGRPAILFTDLRPFCLSERGKPVGKQQREDDPSRPNQELWVTDMGRFFQLFHDRRLALDIFTILEDGRLDHRVQIQYRGIALSYKQIQQGALSQRAAVEQLPLRQAMVELLVYLSLGEFQNLKIPTKYADRVFAMVSIVRLLTNLRATVEDSAEATLRVYAILSGLPNVVIPPEQWESRNLAEEDMTPTELDELLERLKSEETDISEDEGNPYQSPEQVDYRGEFKPELVQTLAKLRMEGRKAEGQHSIPLTKELLEQILQSNPEVNFDIEDDENASALENFAQNLFREAGVNFPPSNPGQGYGPISHEEEPGGSLEVMEPRSFVYDEWDYRAGDYKPRWCVVREKNMESGDNRFFEETLKSYASLTANIRRQFELVIPESFRKIKRLPDGDDLDLDDTIEAVIDRLSGITPSDKVYWRRNKVHRDVAVVFLLDMSASTAEAIEEGTTAMMDRDRPDNPAEYMLWMRGRTESVVRRHHKRIIDLEKESAVLLIQALEAIGDRYGIYGFSGYGRENVEFYVVKDLEEDFNERVKWRIDKIAPLHATRMGPAIRHATAKLAGQSARTKLLFLISDGRPQDRGYSREGVEKEYAVHDTKMALTEARRKAITPFCLTVDKAGHDYLQTMCGDLGYEVLDDIMALPQRLPLLYRRLTT